MPTDRETNPKAMDANPSSSSCSNSRQHEFTPDKNPKAKQTKSTRKRKRQYSSTDDDDLDTSIDEKLLQCAKRNKLTPQNVKNILQKVVRNDHVLAIVRIKEEELERREMAMKETKVSTNGNTTNTSSSTHDDDDDEDDTTESLPKLTRAKAKALNKFPLPVAPIKHSEPDSEVVALISEELHSDDDDEEYQPGEDDIESDDDINTTTSDIDSQPATPSSHASEVCDEPSRPIYSRDGLFKVPRARNDSSTSQTEQDYIIAQRTRSKVSLAGTPIEAIESTFKAPDAPSDMYQYIDIDNPNWTNFLEGLAMPMTSEMEKDEDADPDYCPAVDQPDDREEFLHGNVPKRELYDLLNDYLGDIDLSAFDMLFAADGNPAAKQANINADDLNATLITPVKQIEDATVSSENIVNEAKSKAVTAPPASPSISNTNISYFDPSAMSTPAKAADRSTEPSPTQSQSQSFDSFNSTLLAPPSQVNDNNTLMGQQITYRYPNSFGAFGSNSTILTPVMTCVTNSNAIHQSSTEFAPNLILMSSEAITTPAISSTVISSFQSNGNPIETKRSARERPGHRAKRSRFKSAIYRELENFDPNTIQPKYFYPVDERGFTAEQRQILNTQLRQHVQLATQSYVQTYGHPELYAEAHQMKRFLKDFKEMVDKKHAKPIHNLQPALDLISDWEIELSQNTKENTELVKHLVHEMSKLRRNLSYVMPFHERILNLISQSKVFMYPELLPQVPFRFKTTKPSEYLPAEDFLIAFLLEHFFYELRQKSQSYKFAKPKEVCLTEVCKHISAHLGYIRHWKSIYDYVRLRRNNSLINPIKFYFQHKRAPPIQHHYEQFDPMKVVEPAKQPVTALPSQWARHVEKLICLNQDKLLNGNPIPTLKRSRRQSSSSSSSSSNKGYSVSILNNSREIGQSSEKFDVHEADLTKTPIQVKIFYGPTNNNSQNTLKIENIDSSFKCDINENCTANDSLSRGQTLLTSYFRPIERKPKKSIDVCNDDAENHHDFDNDNDYCDDDDELPKLEIDYAPTSELMISDSEKTDKKCLLLNRKRIRKKYSRISTVRQRVTKLLTCLARTIRKQFCVNWHRFHDENVLFVYQCIISFHRFTSAFVEQSKRKDTILNESKLKMTTEAITINRRVQKLLNDNNGNVKETNDDAVTTVTTPIHNDGGAKRPPKNQRSSDNSRLLLLTDNAHESSEKDFVFAQRFLDRVEETFFNENKHHKFFEFLQILRNFSEQQQQTGAHLYLTLEKFFMPDYPELADTFLYFMTPSDAVAINKSMEHFLKVNYTKFLNKLNIFFHKQPAQIRKVFACLKELSEEPDVTIERIRSRILPLLKSNQLLIDWFLQCIGPDKCESSKDEYETLVLRKGNESIVDDQFECIPMCEIQADPNDNPCHIRYQNGRLFYGNRFPLPAKLSFGAVPCSTITSELVEADRQLLTGGANKTVSYRCVHNIKEFADSKMRDRHHSELEPVAGTNEVENNSDEEQQHSVTPTIIKVEEKSGFEEETETPSAILATGGTSEQTLCDDTLLKAHSIRLNPSLHTSLLHMNAELLNKLKPPDQNASETNRELRMSPKKQATAKCATNIQAKSSQCRKVNSPNAKKVTTAGSKSPNSRKTSSPQANSAESLDNSAIVPPSHDSNAIQTAKKLKRILETHESTPSTSSQSGEIDEANKRPTDIISMAKSKSQKTQMMSRPIKKQKRAHDYHESDDEDDTANNMDGHCKKNETTTQNENENRKEQQQQKQQQNQKDNPQPEIQWTREEDRLLLEQIKAGFDSNSASIAEFAHRFPNKTQENIRDRIDFLIDFLTKLRNKN